MPSSSFSPRSRGYILSVRGGGRHVRGKGAAGAAAPTSVTGRRGRIVVPAATDPAPHGAGPAPGRVAVRRGRGRRRRRAHPESAGPARPATDRPEDGLVGIVDDGTGLPRAGTARADLRHAVLQRRGRRPDGRTNPGPSRVAAGAHGGRNGPVL